VSAAARAQSSGGSAARPVAADRGGTLRSLVLGRILALVGLLVANGFFVAAEFSVVRSRRSRLEAMARAGDTKARMVLKATANMARLLSASQFGITLASLGIGALAEETLKHSFETRFAMMALPAQVSAATLGTVAALAIVTYGHVVFGELAPRSAALNHPEEVSRWLVPPLMVFAWLTAPFTWVLNKSAELVLRMFRQTAMNAEENVHSAEELRILVEQSQEGGVLERQDAALIEGVFEFSEKNAREVMTPRTEIDALDIESTLEEAIQFIIDTQRSRYPVYEESIDNIIGLVLAKDLIPVLRASPPQFALTAIMRPIHVVPGSREVEEVLADFKRRKEHMAVVLDEYGGTAGVVTMEDLLEEIVGEILDEHDEPEMAATTGEPGADVVVPGAMHIGELNERYGLDVPDDEYTTIGGYIFGALGRLPTVGDRVTASHAVFTVKSMDGRRIEALAVDLHSVGDRRAKQRSEG
jgi:CBS domain containing-hemolysin-like protein